MFDDATYVSVGSALTFKRESTLSKNEEIAELKKRRKEVLKEIKQVQANPVFCQAEMTKLKREKLALKQRIAKLESQSTQSVAAE